MIELTSELIRKHRELIEGQVKGYTKRSKTGKTFAVRAHERDIKNMSNRAIAKEIKSLSAKSWSSFSKGGQSLHRDRRKELDQELARRGLSMNHNSMRRGKKVPA